MSDKRDSVQPSLFSGTDPYEITDAIRLTLADHLQTHLEGKPEISLREFVQEGPRGEPRHAFGLVLGGVFYTVELTRGRRQTGVEPDL